MKKNTQARRSFIKQASLLSAGLTIPISAKSYNRIIGSNERIRLAVAGLNSRGRAHIYAARSLKTHIDIAGLCDVDNRVFKKIFKEFPDYVSPDTTQYKDIRKLLDNQSIDAISIATPDHWHAPMAIMAMQAGKDVYLEKPSNYNPEEGDWLVEAQRKTGKVLQIGNQQRSGPTSIEIIEDIKAGIIGAPYFAKAWYSNTRGSIGNGKTANVPGWLDWDLWQGPAPRREYKDNYVHYNWHWFWHWGTGEINNNALHELDICRWALGVDIPNEVSSSGGRYHFDDDWEFYDTQIASFQFPENKMITWEGRSCTGLQYFDRGRGSSIHGTGGSVIMDRGGYEVYDLKNKLVKQEFERSSSATLNTLGIGGLDNLHMLNFVNAIKKGEKLRSHIGEAVKSNLMCHLGNMAQKYSKVLKVDTQTGRPIDDEAMQLWSREYQSGWKPEV